MSLTTLLLVYVEWDVKLYKLHCNHTHGCFVHRSVARNVTTADSDRAASTAVSSPVTIANGVASSDSKPHRAVPHARPKERPQSIGSQLEPLKSADVKRSSSIRLEDISSPRLQSSTNHTVAEVPSSHGNESEAAGTKLLPTRVAPVPPVEQSRRPPQRPPPPCTATRDLSTGTPAANQYEEISLKSPTGPPPAPPDSRHRFYSSQIPRRPPSVADQTDGAPPSISVSSMRSKFEPIRSSSPSNAVAHRQPRRDLKNCSSNVPVKSQTRPQHATARPSPSVNESQC